MDILRTNEANCKDCYKCIRYCPVNAIRVSDGHAQIDPDRCILDGKCYKICPQKAKIVRNDIEIARNVIKFGHYTVASVAPSFFGYYDKEKSGKLLTALMYLGFDQIEQTSSAAYAVAKAHFDYYKKTNNLVITSSCPSTVNLIEKYYPELIPNLAPVVSPMIAHYKILKNEIRKQFKMVFIGPCIAKKQEIENTEISAAITFEELENWIEEEGIDLDALEITELENSYNGPSSLFPLLGGLIKTAGMSDSNLENDFISVDGIERIKELLESIKSNRINSKFVEVLACEGGCLMGPARPDTVKDSTYFELKSNLLEFCTCNNDKTVKITEDFLDKQYEDKSLKNVLPSEEEIRVILASIGKAKPEDEHNCGACGYNSCREKAIAVIQGMAEKEMCIPYMRSQAERFSAIVLEATPNCVVVLDHNLNIIEANPAFLKLMEVDKGSIIGQNISAFIDDAPFREVLENDQVIKESRTLLRNREIKRIVFSVPDQKLITGIFVDVTDAETHKAALIKVRNETLERAQKVIDKQMRVAQEVAGLLGETTAETKVLLGQLVKILQQE